MSEGEILTVRFRVKENGGITGHIVDPLPNQKNVRVLLDGYRFGHKEDWRSLLPRDSEHWSCDVVSEKARHGDEGFMFVRLRESTLSIFLTACGGRLLVDERVLRMLQANVGVLELLPEVGTALILPGCGDVLCENVDLGRIIGRSGCVETPTIGLDDPALFAIRTGRQSPSRVMRDVQGPEVRTVAVFAERGRDQGKFFLRTAYIGTHSPREPFAGRLKPVERAESLAFWCSHALVFDGEVMTDPFTSTWRAVLAQRFER